MTKPTSMAMAPPAISVVVPVYGSQSTLRFLVERVSAVFRRRGEIFELIFVDDASPDDCWAVLQELHRDDPEHVTIVQLMRNVGQHNAIMCGFRHVRGRFIVTIDDDLQNPPEEIPKLLNKLREENLDLVYGVPEKKRHAVGRNVGSRLVNVFFRLVFRQRVTVTSFRCIRRELLDAILTYNLNFTYIDGLLAWNSQRIAQVNVSHEPRRTGVSGYSLGKLLTLALNLFTNFSLLPLQTASAVGLLAAVLGLLAGMYYLALALLSRITVPGYASIIVAVLTLGGLQLLALGVIGEYVGRMHLNLNRKPQYTVRTAHYAGPHGDDGPSDDSHA